MNLIYRLIWNPCLSMYVPAPESGRGRGKGSGLCALGALVLSSLSLAAHAMPMGGEVTAGQGSIAQSGSAMTVNQQSANLAINWQSFGIGAAESVSFAQPGTSAIALNRVLGGDLSQIHGRLSANGQVWLLNPNGVLFGGGAQVNVGGLVASTLNISDADFLAGKRSFSGNGGKVTNQGTISAADGGYVALLGGKVSNEGVIQARLGTVAMGAGNQITLDFAGDKLLNLQVDQAALEALVQNKQLIAADGGTVILSTSAANDLLDTVVNNTGVIEARTIDTRNGTIKLLGGSVRVAGTLDASAPNAGDGGLIETSGAQVKVSEDVRVTTAAGSGKTGQWSIAESGSVTITPGGGGISGATLAGQLATTNVTIVARGESDSGDVHVNDDIDWNSANSLTLSAASDVKVVKSIDSSGTGDVNLRADSAGACVAGAERCGTVSFAPKAAISANGGTVNLYYNPAGSNNPADANGNGPSYASPSDFSRYATLNGGSTLNAWMLVNDVNQLQGMSTNLGGSYALGGDVDAAATVGWNTGAGFMPVGVNPFFTGQFDGGGYAISGLVINRPELISTPVGLFGRNGGSIANIGLSGGNVNGRTYVGGLAGWNYGSISNSHSSSSVSGYETVGGLAGNNSGSISNSDASGRISGQSAVGGLVGYNYSTIDRSHATGNVSGDYGVGGLVGYGDIASAVSSSYATGNVSGGSYFAGGLLGANVGSISTSYASGNVTGNITVGGLVGWNYAGNPSIEGRISDSYATGSVSGTRTVGGLVAYNSGGIITSSYASGSVNGGAVLGGLVAFNDSGTISNSYWDTTTSGQSTSAGGTGLTTSQMMQQASFAGFDFTNTWWMSEGNTRPFLRMEYSTTVNNAHQLQLIALHPGASYTLGRDVDMSELSKPSGLWNASTGFVPIGFLASDPFTGAFDGLGHAITGLQINRPLPGSSTRGVGLFGVNNGQIRNIAVVGGAISGGYGVGGVVGVNYQGTVENSYSSATVKGIAQVGGLVGLNAAIVNNNHSASAVDGAAEIGGLVGTNRTGTVSNSYSTGAVNASGNIVGGLVGSNESGGIVSNSYSTGAVNGSSSVGGLAGNNHGGQISNSHSTGSVSGNLNSVGGLVGYNDGGFASNTYATGNVSGRSYVGGLVGYNSGGSIDSSHASGNVSGHADVGGLIGINSSGRIDRSYATGTVNGYSIVGGLVGYNYNGSSIRNSYATGNVSGDYYVGGLVGVNQNSTIGSSYATGNVSGGSYVGGLIGHKYGGIVFTSYWNTTTSGQSTSAGGTGLTDAQMKQKGSFFGFDFVNIWGIDEGVSYPFLLAH